MIRPRILLGAGSVAIMIAAMALATANGPEHVRFWLQLCGIVAIAAAAQSAALNAWDLTPALLFALPPVVSLAADGSPTWLIGPLAALLLFSAELNALSWECQAANPLNPVQRRRLRNSARLTSLGLATVIAIGAIATGVSVGGTAAMVAAAAAIAVLGFLVFRS